MVGVDVAPRVLAPPRVLRTVRRGAKRSPATVVSRAGGHPVIAAIIVGLSRDARAQLAADAKGGAAADARAPRGAEILPTSDREDQREDAREEP